MWALGSPGCYTSKTMTHEHTRHQLYPTGLLAPCWSPWLRDPGHELRSNQQAGTEWPRPGCWLFGKLFHEFCSSDYKLRATSRRVPVYTYKCIINADKQSEQEDSRFWMWRGDGGYSVYVCKFGQGVPGYLWLKLQSSIPKCLFLPRWTM